MAIGNKSQRELVPQDLRKQLALAVRSIQWSYAVFWSLSSRQPGVLEWGDGYYNGDIKTRKTVQVAEADVDQLGLQRSDQLRELYESLSIGETNPQAKRPTAALSPEDLTDAEWYFLVCMSFIFNFDQGLPGKTFVNNQTIWLCNAHRADTKVFTRSLLAKSASIQTIVCFPHFGGVVELGTTAAVSEDLNLIQHVKISFLEPSKISNYVSNSITDDAEDDGLDQLLDCPGINIPTPTNCSNDLADNLLRNESHLAEVDKEASQIQQLPFMDDTISNCLNNSMASSDCVSQTYINPVGDTQENGGQNSAGFEGNENHYHCVLSNLLKSSDQLILGPYFRNGTRESSFITWRKDGLSSHSLVPQSGTPQRLLKKVLFEVTRMHESLGLESDMQTGSAKLEADDRNHMLSERKRREKINERFSILGSLVPSGGKVDKVSILDHTIEHLRKLERKIEELENKQVKSTTQMKPQDAIERTSDNYGTNKNGSTTMNKRKASEIDRLGPENSKLQLQDSSTGSVTVSVADRDVLIEIQCLWKDCIVIDVMEAISKLRMDVKTVQSSNTDGILSMTVKAKSKALKAASPNMVGQALQKVIRKC